MTLDKIIENICIISLNKKMIAFMLLRTIFLIGIISCYSLGMFRLINQFFGDRYRSYLQEEFNKKPHLKSILKQDKVTTVSSFTSLVNMPTHPTDILLENERINVYTCRKIDRFYKITVTMNLFCTAEQKGVDKTIAVNDDNDKKLQNNYYKNSDLNDNDVILKYEHINESNNDNIKKIQLKKMLNINVEQSKNDNEKHKFYHHVESDNADFNIENEGEIEIYEHQKCYSSTTDQNNNHEHKCSINQGMLFKFKSTTFKTILHLNSTENYTIHDFPCFPKPFLSLFFFFFNITKDFSDLALNDDERN